MGLLIVYCISRRVVKHLTPQNRELRAMIESQKEKNKDLLEQVQSLRDRLQKVEASKHALRKSMMQLQNIVSSVERVTQQF